MIRLLTIILALILTLTQAGHSVRLGLQVNDRVDAERGERLVILFNTQNGQAVSDSQKREFIELLKTLPFRGEFYTEEAARRAAPYLPVLFSLTEKDVEKYDLYSFVAISVGISRDKERRAYAVAHFAEIRHPKLKLF